MCSSVHPGPSTALVSAVVAAGCDSGSSNGNTKPRGKTRGGCLSHSSTTGYGTDEDCAYLSVHRRT